MPEPTDPWWSEIRVRVADLLAEVDARDEYLIAAFLADALWRIDARMDTISLRLS